MHCVETALLLLLCAPQVTHSFSGLISPSDTLVVHQTEEIRTFEYQSNPLEGSFLLFELTLDADSPQPNPFFLSAGFSPTSDFASIETADYIDYSGWYGAKRYSYLVVETAGMQERPPLSVAVYANLTGVAETVRYTLSLRTSEKELCPNECFGHGKCELGVCNCASNYGDFACDVPLLSLTSDQTLVLDTAKAVYLYLDTDDMLGNSVTFKWSSGFPEILSKEGLCEYRTPLPSRHEHRDWFLASDSSGEYEVKGRDYACSDSKYWSFRVSQVAVDPVAITVSVSRSSKSEATDVMIIVISIVGATVAVAWGAFLLWKCSARVRRGRQRVAEEANRPLARMQQMCPKQAFRALAKADIDYPCAICLEEFRERSEVRVLPCSHVYHLACIDEWFTRSTVCCSCKSDVFKGENVAQTEANETRLNESVMQTDLRVLPLE